MKLGDTPNVSVAEDSTHSVSATLASGWAFGRLYNLIIKRPKLRWAFTNRFVLEISLTLMGYGIR
jgi:hypothetical protein